MPKADEQRKLTDTKSPLCRFTVCYLMIKILPFIVQARAQSVTRTTEEEPRNGLQAFSPQGGESSGWVGMCLVRLKTHRPASQVSLPCGKEATLSRALVWAGVWWGGWPAVESRKIAGFCGPQLPVSPRRWLSGQYFKAAVKDSNSVRWLCVHRSLGSFSTHKHTINTAYQHSYPHACFHAAHSHATHTIPAVTMESSRPQRDRHDSSALQRGFCPLEDYHTAAVTVWILRQ